MSNRALLTVSYDGTRYAGWQSQTNALSVQQVLEEALTGLFMKPSKVIGGGRTDAGVHALGQRALIIQPDELPIPVNKLHLALNARLPEDIRALASESVGNDFHPIRSARSKTYSYSIYNRPVMPPLLRFYAAHERHPLDISAMQEAAGYFTGKHDFAGFCSTGGSAATTEREIFGMDVEANDGLIKIKVTGNGFLYNMVRIIAGTLLMAGKAVIAPNDIPDIIKSGDRRKAGITMPARGLTLCGIRYLDS